MMTKRSLLLCFITLVTLVACSEPTRTPVPTPTVAITPTPVPPSAEDTAKVFLAAWQQADYAGMYRQLAPGARLQITDADFAGLYRKIQTEAIVLNVRAQTRATLKLGGRTQVTFHEEWDTGVFGTLQAENVMTLTLTENRWGVNWDPGLIWPGLGGGNQMRMTLAIPERANIYDRDGLGLAYRATNATLGVIPGEITDEAALLNALSQATGLAPDAIKARYAQASPTWYVPITTVSGDTYVQYRPLLDSQPGFEARSKSVRTYRPGGIAAHTIGYYGLIPQAGLETYRKLGYRGDEWVGLVGLERWGEKYLAGSHGGQLDIVNAQGQVVSTLAAKRPVLSRPLFTTIKRPFQEKVERILDNADTVYGPHKSTVVALDPNNGQILAISSHPGFDPNEIVNPSLFAQTAPLTPTEKSYVHRAVMGLYHPGSTFKPIVMAAALEAGLFTPDSVFDDPGYWDGLGSNFRKTCWKEEGHGRISLVNALSASCNVAFYQLGFAENKHDVNLLPNMARAFGLGRLTGIVGLDEQVGLVPDMAYKNAKGEPWYDGDAVNLSIGQGDLQVTPLQMAVAYSAIANGGTVYKPQLVLRIGSQDQGPEEVLPTEVVGTLPVKPENLAAIKQGLRGVVAGAVGTARHIFIGMPVRVAGKTGTAETGTARPDAWFAAYAPSDAPEIVVVVMVEDIGQGSAVAAPIARNVMEAYFGYAQTPLPPLPPETEPADR
jgi:penicillin-binding protein 2